MATHVVLLCCVLLCGLRQVEGRLNLKFVVGLGRHSIKAESWSSVDYYSDLYSSNVFVERHSVSDRGGSMISSHGLQAAEFTGFSLFDVYASYLFPDFCDDQNSSSSKVLFYADGGYPRCIETARLLMKGMQYACPTHKEDRIGLVHLGPHGNERGEGSPYRVMSEGQKDNMYPGCRLAHQNETLLSYGVQTTPDDHHHLLLNTSKWNGPDEYIRQNLRLEMKLLSESVGFKDSLWCTTNPSLCVTKTLLDVPTVWYGGYWQPWTSGWDIASAFINALYFQASNNAPILNGTLSVDDVMVLKRIQVQGMLSYTNDFNMRSFQQDLIIHLLALLEQAATGKSLGVSEVQAGVGSKMVIFNGHDSNILNLLAWLGADAVPYHMPANTPGYLTHIMFELWEESETHQVFVRVVYHTPSTHWLREQRDPRQTPLDRRWQDWRSVVPIPGCSHDGSAMCDLGVFKRILLNRIWGQVKLGCMSQEMEVVLRKLTQSTSGVSAGVGSSNGTGGDGSGAGAGTSTNAAGAAAGYQGRGGAGGVTVVTILAVFGVGMLVVGGVWIIFLRLGRRSGGVRRRGSSACEEGLMMYEEEDDKYTSPFYKNWCEFLSRSRLFLREGGTNSSNTTTNGSTNSSTTTTAIINRGARSPSKRKPHHHALL